MNCRLCLNESQDALSIFAVKDENNLLELIYKYLFLKIEYDDVFSTTICQHCFQILRDFHNYYQSIQKCQLKLRAMQTKSNDQPIIFKEEEHESERINYQTPSTEHVDEVPRTGQSCTDTSQSSSELPSSYEEIANNSSKEDSINHSTKKDTLSADIPTIDKNYGSSFQSMELYDDHLHTTECIGPEKHENISSDDIKNRTCCVCFNVYSTVSKMKAHFRRQHNKKQETVENRTCPICSKEYTTIERMKKHLRYFHSTGHQDVQDRTCHLCSKVYPTIQNKERHILRSHGAGHQNVQDRTCSICSKVYSSIEKVKSHMRLRHNEKNVDINNRICSICCTVYSTVYNLKQHMNLQHNKKKEAVKQRTCHVCSKVYPTIQNMKRHLLRCHSNDDIQNRTCPICSKVVKNIHSLRSHFSSFHGNVKPFACSYCGKIFDTQSELQAHPNYCLGTISKNLPDDVKTTNKILPEAFIQNTCNDVEYHLCNICNKRLRTKSDFRRHMQVFHLDVKPFSCSECGKMCLSLDEIESHFLENSSKCNNAEQMAKLELHKNTAKAMKKSPAIIGGTQQETHNALDEKLANKIKNQRDISCHAEEQHGSSDMQVKEEDPLDIDE